MKKSIDFGISAKQSYMHVLWQGNYLECFEDSKNVFTMETRFSLQVLLKTPNDLPGARDMVQGRDSVLSLLLQGGVYMVETHSGT